MLFAIYRCTTRAFAVINHHHHHHWYHPQPKHDYLRFQRLYRYVHSLREKHTAMAKKTIDEIKETEKTDKAERTMKTEKTMKIEKEMKTEKAVKTAKAIKSSKAVEAEKAAKAEKEAKAESETATKPAKTDKKEEPKKREPFVTKKVPSHFTLQILGNASNGAPQSVFLFTEGYRYLFNCGEGTQRLASEHRTKLTRLQTVFLTRSTWDVFGGFPGLSLTLRDAEVPHLYIQGPPYLSTIVHTMINFASVKAYHTAQVIESNDETYYEDGTLTVQSIMLHGVVPNAKELGNVKVEDEEGEQTVPVEDEERKKKAITVEIPYSDIETTVVNYVCFVKPKLGSLKIEKCVEFGVPPGPLLSKLKNGEDIVLDNGKVVRSKDVCTESECWRKIIFLDVPSESFLPTLEFKEDYFKKSWKDVRSTDDENGSDKKIQEADGKTEVAVIVHFTPQHIVENPVYVAFCRRISDSTTEHLVVNGHGNKHFSGFLSSQAMQYQLNLLNPKMFPILSESQRMLDLKQEEAGITAKEDKKAEKECNGSGFDIVPLGPFTSYNLRGKKGVDHDSELHLEPEKHIKEAEDTPGFLEVRDSLHKAYKELSYDYTATELIGNAVDKPKYPILTFLGTGSCAPNKTRNVSAIIIQPADNCYVLLDCGEGTLGQMKRFFGIQRTDEILQNLKIIFVSHQHADHHLGLFNILKEKINVHLRNQGQIKEMDKLLLMAPIQIKQWIQYYDTFISRINPIFHFVSNAVMLADPLALHKANVWFDEPLPNIVGVRTCLVRHSVHAYAISFEFVVDDYGEPVKITYSGDTMPCNDLVKLGQDSTILIHEATMEDELIEDARCKFHSTMSQAIDQGIAMNAKYTILTHFSQRYSKMPRIQYKDENGKFLDRMLNVALAFDNMQLQLGDLEYYHLIYDPIWTLYADDIEQLEVKAQKRLYALKRPLLLEKNEELPVKRK